MSPAVRRLAPGLLGLPAALLLVLPAWAKGKARQEPQEPPDTRPPVSLTVSLTDKGPDTPWILKVENASSAPVKLVDDPELLWLTVGKPGDKKPKECHAPDSAGRKEEGTKRVKELQAGQSVMHLVDPRFFCFSAGKQEVLVPAAQIVPHYGFPEDAKARPRRRKKDETPARPGAPFVARPSDETGQLAPLKSADGDPVVLDSSYAAWSTPPEDPKDEPALEISRGSDAETERSVTATVRVKNATHGKLRLFFRRELLTFKVKSLKGEAECPGDADTKNPDRGSFTGIAPGGSTSLTLRLVETCPRGTFAQSGLYLVGASLRATADGADYGIEAFTGTLETKRDIPIRVRKSIHLEPVRPRARPAASGAPAAPGAAAAPPPAPAPAPPPAPPPAGP